MSERANAGDCYDMGMYNVLVAFVAVLHLIPTILMTCAVAIYGVPWPRDAAGLVAALLWPFWVYSAHTLVLAICGHAYKMPRSPQPRGARGSHRPHSRARELLSKRSM